MTKEQSIEKRKLLLDRLQYVRIKIQEGSYYTAYIAFDLIKQDIAELANDNKT